MTATLVLKARGLSRKRARKEDVPRGDKLSAVQWGGGRGGFRKTTRASCVSNPCRQSRERPKGQVQNKLKEVFQDREAEESPGEVWTAA